MMDAASFGQPDSHCACKSSAPQEYSGNTQSPGWRRLLVVHRAVWTAARASLAGGSGLFCLPPCLDLGLLWPCAAVWGHLARHLVPDGRAVMRAAAARQLSPSGTTSMDMPRGDESRDPCRPNTQRLAVPTPPLRHWVLGKPCNHATASIQVMCFRTSSYRPSPCRQPVRHIFFQPRAIVSTSDRRSVTVLLLQPR